MTFLECDLPGMSKPKHNYVIGIQRWEEILDQQARTGVALMRFIDGPNRPRFALCATLGWFGDL